MKNSLEVSTAPEKELDVVDVESAHNRIKVFCPNSTVRVSIPPACCNKRIKRVWKKDVCLQLWFYQIKEKDRGPQFTSGVSP